MTEFKNTSYREWLGLKTLQSKIFMLIAFFVVAFVSITLIVFYENRLTIGINRKGVDVNAPSTITALELTAHIRESQKNLYEYLGNPQNVMLLRADSLWTNHIEPTLQKLITLKNKLASPTDQKLIDTVQTIMSAFRQAQRNTMKVYKEQINASQIIQSKDSTKAIYQMLYGEKQARTLANSVYQKQVEPISNYVQRLLNKFVQGQQNVLTENFRSLEKSVQVMDVSVLFISLVVAFLGVILGYSVLNSLQRSVEKPTLLMKRLAQGELPAQIIETQDEFNPIIKACNQLVGTLKKVSTFALEIGEGNLQSDFKALSEKDMLGNSLIQMRERLKIVTEDDKRRNWATEGYALIGDVVRKHSNDIQMLCDQVLTALVEYTGAIQGGIFIYQEKDGKRFLEMKACYAYSRKKYIQKEIKLNEDYAETLIGQVYLEQQKIYMTHLPEDYTYVSSGLGKTTPSALLLTPLKTNQRIEGVMEIIALKPLQQHEIEFIERISETIGVALTSVMANVQNIHLLSDSQVQSEVMRKQEQEMRKNIEEMRLIQEKMSLMQEELQAKETNLSALINSTDESLVAIDTNYIILAINDEVRNRYKNTNYDGIDIGKNVLHYLGAVKDEWQERYQRAFAGEKFDFVKKTALDGKNSYRHYFVSPIQNQNGEVTGASIFSRDISREKNQEEMQAERIKHLEKEIKLYEKLGGHLILDWQGNILKIDHQIIQQLGYTLDDLIGKPAITLGERVGKLQKSPFWQGEEVEILNAQAQPKNYLAQRVRRQEAQDKQIHYLLFPLVFESPISERN